MVFSVLYIYSLSNITIILDKNRRHGAEVTQLVYGRGRTSAQQLHTVHAHYNLIFISYFSSRKFVKLDDLRKYLEYPQIFTGSK